MKTSNVAAEAVERKWAFSVPRGLTSRLPQLSMQTWLISFFALCSLAVVASRWGYAFAVPPHTPVYANFDIGFQYLYADYFRDHASFPSTPADISHGASDGYFWWWWDNEYFSKYMGFAAAIIGVFMWLGVPFVPAYAIVTWIADLSIVALAYRLVSSAAGRRGGVIAAVVLAVHPLFVWGVYQAHVQISVGIALFLGVVACWRQWSEYGQRRAIVLAAILALAASHAHAFFLSMLLSAFVPAVALHTLVFQRTRHAVVRQGAFLFAVAAGLLANTRFWLNLDTYSEVTRSMIGRSDGWGQLPSPLFLLGLSARPESWQFGPTWLVLVAFLGVVTFAVIQSFSRRNWDGHTRALAVVFSVMFVLDVAYMFGAHRIQYNYWILRHAQFHVVLGILPASMGLAWLMRSSRRAWRVGAFGFAAVLTATCLLLSFEQMAVARSHGPAYAEFLADRERPKLPYVVLMSAGGTALTPFTCAITETPVYDLNSASVPPLLDHLERHYGWKRGDEMNVLWYSEVSSIPRKDMHFTSILGEWSTSEESVVLGTVRLNIGGAREPLLTSGDGWVLTDRIQFEDPASEAAHKYRVDAPAFKGTAAFFREEDRTVHVRSGRATRSFEEFQLHVTPGMDHALVKGLDTVSTGQVARVIVDGDAVLTWEVDGGRERYSESMLTIPASVIGRKTEISIRIEYVAGSLGINAYSYWMFSKPTVGIESPLMTDTSGYRLVDSLDVGDVAEETAHQYAIREQTFFGRNVFKLHSTNRSYVETGRATKSGEQFTVRAMPGKEHLLIKAYDNFSRHQRLRVTVDDVFVGVWELPTRDERYGEAAFVVPASFITDDSVVVNVQFMSASVDQNSFVYWVYAQSPGLNQDEVDEPRPPAISFESRSSHAHADR